MLRRILSEVESLAHRKRKAKAIYKWRTGNSPYSSEESFRVHIMLVKDVKYLELAEVCVFSFLHYHPKAHFTLYCDKNTFSETTKKFLSSIQSEKYGVATYSKEAGKSW